ncbi:MAG: phosphoglycerate dehydrogenase [Rhodospirillaceae bacterium]|jgi:D-3-phosphoglycerate dehydrogenase / 2-oxoglutarate reductase|nr:phosphoglycerate dehydrogenase [Rhodospirillaceae bacterium]MBT5242615.1 phosphoglycerate dehydrogenase [Rhodospirillaceae bacterium]MBT5561368.1 phosphoglycerate dehydrogenase [Rhodospirillaceae bacterium]MBT6242007.1 phosphoglycerate dehydrogenase [Rhodospirillaceae bacterium]MBT7136709.1 phosphoglycerate dehydrogenase [Rhodospirillaceae bacterium]
MPKVLISDKMSPLAAEIFANRGVDVDVKPGMSPEELIACIGDYDGLAVRSATKATAAVLAAAENLKVIGRAGIGVDNIDVAAATAAGVCVMNTPFGNSITTAEHAIAMITALSRQIPHANASTHAGKWEKSKFMGVEIMGKILGIIGCGNIGAVVADRAQGLKMRVIAFDPYLSPERAAELGVEKVELDDLFARADFISLHTPLTDTTRDIINADAIDKMKPGVRIINCARGGLIVEEDLKAGLENGKVAAAGLDVFAEEPARDNPLFGMENVVATPHLGASTTEAQEKVALQVAEQMADYLVSGAVTNALNMPSVTAEEAPRLKPYMQLAEQLGSFAGQLTESGLEGVTLEYEGHVAELNTRPLTAIVLQGLLSPLMESVNMVNAPVIAKERDIDVTEIKHERASAYQTLIKLTVKTENQSRSVAGTLFAGAHPRIVEIKGIPMDAELGSNMLFITNKDTPGFIGSLGTTLGDAGINIATFHLGRAEAGGDAIALIEVDGEPAGQVMDDICKLEQVVQVKALTF